MKQIRVLVVDDSLFLRRNLPRILENDPEITVVGTAANGLEAVEKVKSLRPDVVTLDLMMPVMDGLTALKHIMRDTPTPVVIVSATSREGARETLEALALGAIDFVTKPSGPVSLDIDSVSKELIEKVQAAYAAKIKIAAQVDVTDKGFRRLVDQAAHPVSSPAVPPRPLPHFQPKRLVAIVASTGGPTALRLLVAGLPRQLDAGIVIVQHIAAGFSAPLAARLDEISPLTVSEAKNGDIIRPGKALVAPTSLHLTVMRRGGGLFVRLDPEPAGVLHRPSGNVLFESLVECCPRESCGVILTGMGEDGALGMSLLHEQGGYTIAQDEATSVIYGMPRRAAELGGVDVILPIERIAREIVRVTRRS